MDKIKYAEYLFFLQNLISTPSISRNETDTAEVISSFFEKKGVKIERQNNNIWIYNRHFSDQKPTILLNSHHDTVKPNSGYSRDPFEPTIEDGKLFGLGSNDAGGSVVALSALFMEFYDREDLKYNLCLAITAEEEVSGVNGVESIIPLLKNIEFGIVGEPTNMRMAIAERGLMVLDCVAKGQSGHAARKEGVNAIYKALKDIAWFQNYQFERGSDLIGEVMMNVTIINSGTTHNTIPAECSFTVDIRLNECYTHQEVLDIVRDNVECSAEPRSMRLKPSGISLEHPIVAAGLELGLEYFGSPTSSDQALMSFPTLKIGVGESARSHSANEFVYLQEIYDGIEIYKQLLNKIL